MILKASTVVILSCFTSALVIDIDEPFTDQLLPVVNQALTKKGLGVVSFGAIADNKMNTSSGIQIGLNSLERRGKCTLAEVGESAYYYDFRLGFRLFFLAFEEINISGESISAVFKINKNEIHVSFWQSWDKNAKSKVTLDHYDISNLDDVVLYSSNPKFDNTDVSSLFREYGRSKINANLKTLRQAVEEAFQEQFGY